MEYGKLSKFNNYLQGFKRSKLALLMFLPIAVFFTLVLVEFGRYDFHFSTYSYVLIVLAFFSVVCAFYITEAILKPRNEFERQISDLKLDPPDRFDRESIIEWWNKTESFMAGRIADLILRARHAHKTATYLATQPYGGMINQRDLRLIANLGENANLLVQHHKFYTYMEKFPNTYPSGQMFLG